MRALSRMDNEVTELPNITKFSSALCALDRLGLLKDRACKEQVVLFIRLATESQDIPRHWHASANYRSMAAQKILSAHTIRTQAAYHGFCSKTLAHEHMVPNIVLYRMICAEPVITQAFLESLFKRFSLRATITRDENKKLLRHTMPPGFHTPGHAYHLDPFARYKAAGLYDTLTLRTTGSWFGDPGAPIHSSTS